MPTLLHRSNGIFYYVASDGGRRRWRSLKTRDPIEAKDQFDALVAERRERQEMRLSYFIRDFCDRRTVHLSASTIALYRASLTRFQCLIGNRPIRKLTRFDVDKFTGLRAKEVKPVTVNIDLRLLRAAFNDALRLKLIDENPFQGVRLLRGGSEEAPFLSEPQLRRLLMVVHDEEFKALILTAVLTMLRRGELLHLEWEDLDFERKEIMVRNKPGYRVKGGRGRPVPMNDWVEGYLKAKPRRSTYVFPGPTGHPLLGNSVSHKFKKYVIRAELDPRMHFHSLRHTGISMLINRGIPAVVVQKIAGHSSPLTTAIYTHLEATTLQSAVRTFPDLN